MIQRIQTIYMLACVVATLMLFLFPLAAFQIPKATLQLSAFGLTSLTPEVVLDDMHWCLLILLLVMIALPLVAIFLYKKQKRQLRLLIFTTILNAAFYLFFYIFEIDLCEEAAKSLTEGDVMTSCGMLPAIMPAVSIFCCVMAIKGVIYDIALLASADRLRPKRK